MRGLDDHRVLTELDQYVLDAVAGKQDLVVVFGVEGFLQLRAHLDELELIIFFYNVGSHNTGFKMNEKSNPPHPSIGVTFFILNRWVNGRVKGSASLSQADEKDNPFDGRYKPHRELITVKVLPGLWRTAKAPTAFLMPGIALLLIAGGCLIHCRREGL